MMKEPWEGPTRRVYPDGQASEGTCRLEKTSTGWVFTVSSQGEGKPATIQEIAKRVD